jgi:hypothetical protein
MPIILKRISSQFHLSKGGARGLSGRPRQTVHDNPLKVHDRCRFAFFPPLVRGIFKGVIQ